MAYLNFFNTNAQPDETRISSRIALESMFNQGLDSSQACSRLHKRMNIYRSTTTSSYSPRSTSRNEESVRHIPVSQAEGSTLVSCQPERVGKSYKHSKGGIPSTCQLLFGIETSGVSALQRRVPYFGNDTTRNTIKRLSLGC